MRLLEGRILTIEIIAATEAAMAEVEAWLDAEEAAPSPDHVSDKCDSRTHDDRVQTHLRREG
ncbi:hypothetical protein SAMN06295937_101647 [Sphingopyxis flava]|uniref:Uncharacterized protein n=1 Tax=Sphingopyxis flava TaxID=1507287 RepID=A0A1T5DTU9_9SPHN|nr:hypothetical protein SAMN06295937_101647 [Sphingopyxis flava]